MEFTKSFIFNDKFLNDKTDYVRIKDIRSNYKSNSIFIFYIMDILYSIHQFDIGSYEPTNWFEISEAIQQKKQISEKTIANLNKLKNRKNALSKNNFEELLLLFNYRYIINESLSNFVANYLFMDKMKEFMYFLCEFNFNNKVTWINYIEDAQKMIKDKNWCFSEQIYKSTKDLSLFTKLEIILSSCSKRKEPPVMLIQSMDLPEECKNTIILLCIKPLRLKSSEIVDFLNNYYKGEFSKYLKSRKRKNDEDVDDLE